MIGKKGDNNNGDIQFATSGTITKAKCIEECSPICTSCPKNDPTNCLGCKFIFDFTALRTTTTPNCLPTNG